MVSAFYLLLHIYTVTIYLQPSRHKDVGSPLFVVHIGDLTSVVVADPEMVKQVTMQPKNDKSHYFMQKISQVFGER